MKKVFLLTVFFMALIITTKVEAAGNVSLSASKTQVKVGENFTVSLKLSRRAGCFSYCENNG